MMNRHILVPLDGTPLAETILPVAARVAHRAATDLVLLTVVQHNALLDPLSSEAVAYDYLDRVREALTDSDLAAPLPLERIKLRVAQSSFDTEIGDHPEFEQAGLIMMTTHGRNPVSHLVLGSVASKLLKRNCCPMILFKAASNPGEQSLTETLQNTSSWLSTRLSNRVVLALDGSEIAEGAIPQALDLARQLNAELHLLAVVEPPALVADLFKKTPQTAFAINPDHAQIQRRSEARLYLESLAHKLQTSGLVIRVAVESGNPSEAIHAFARRRNSLVVVMATQSGGGRFRLGSVADQVLLQGGIPVLIVPNVQVHSKLVYASSAYQLRPW